MAKKKQNLTPAELLEQALVQEHEWLYEVPENWVWTNMKSVMDVRDGTHDTPKYYSEGIPLITSKNLVEGSIDFSNVKYISVEDHIKISERSKVSNNDILMAMIGTIGNPVVVKKTEEFSIKNVALFKMLKESPLLPQFACYYLTSEQDSMKQNASGGLQPFVSLTFLRNYYFPLPPLAEQQRIVDRIESLFEKLDQAKGLIQDALDSFENRKAVILHKAFSGELTKKWREENGVGMESWKQFKLKDVCSIPITDGTHQTPTYCSKEEGGIPFISAKDVTTGKINWDNIKFITPELHVKLFERIAPQIDDVLLAKNGTTGIAAMVETDKVFDIYVTLALLRPNKELISPKYLLSVINSPNVKNQFNEHLTGIGVPNLHLRDIRVVDIDVPSIDEQHERQCQ